MKKIILSLGLILLPMAAVADCTSDENDFNNTVEQVRQTPSTDGNYKSLQEKAQKMALDSHRSGCTFGNDAATGVNNSPQVSTGNLRSIESHINPSAPGDTNIDVDSTFVKNLSDTAKNQGSQLPKTADIPFTPDAPATPYKDAVYGTSGAAKSCGEVASKYGEYLTSQTGAKALTYKKGCAGANAIGAAGASADYPTAVCGTNQIGKFGLVQAAYGNNEQSISVGNLVSMTPATTGASNSVASYDAAKGIRNNPGGCSLTSYASCGKAGDIIMVQNSGSGKKSDTDYYDNYLIYDGSGGFYYVQPNSTPAVKHGSLPGELANSSYAAVRPACNK